MAQPRVICSLTIPAKMATKLQSLMATYSNTIQENLRMQYAGSSIDPVSIDAHFLTFADYAYLYKLLGVPIPPRPSPIDLARTLNAQKRPPSFHDAYLAEHNQRIERNRQIRESLPRQLRIETLTTSAALEFFIILGMTTFEKAQTCEYENNGANKTSNAGQTAYKSAKSKARHNTKIGAAI